MAVCNSSKEKRYLKANSSVSVYDVSCFRRVRFLYYSGAAGPSIVLVLVVVLVLDSKPCWEVAGLFYRDRGKARHREHSSALRIKGPLVDSRPQTKHRGRGRRRVRERFSRGALTAEFSRVHGDPGDEGVPNGVSPV
jgi:hypothetical protein